MIHSPTQTEGILDITSATSDYVMKVGETVMINKGYTNTVPLNIKVNNQIGEAYELTIVGTDFGDATGSSPMILKPSNVNNTGIVTAATRVCADIDETVRLAGDYGGMYLGHGNILVGKYTISTYYKCQSIVGECMYRSGSNNYYYTTKTGSVWKQWWGWSSLGTVISDSHQSIFIVRRLS